MGCIQCITSTEISNLKIIVPEEALKLASLGSLSNEVNLEIQNISEELIFNTTSIEVRLHTESNNNMVIRHSMLCNIREYVLLISEDEELIIDEDGYFYIEVSDD